MLKLNLLMILFLCFACSKENKKSSNNINSSNKENKNSSTNAHVEAARVDGKLFKLDKTKVASLKDKQYIAYYYTAYWCAPCKKFTPKLVSFYNESTKKDKFEIVLVSSDRSENALHKYMEIKKITFPAIIFAEVGKTKARKYAKRAWPYMAIIDSKGEVLFRGTGNRGLSFLKKLLKD